MSLPSPCTIRRRNGSGCSHRQAGAPPRETQPDPTPARDCGPGRGGRLRQSGRLRAAGLPRAWWRLEPRVSAVRFRLRRVRYRLRLQVRPALPQRLRRLRPLLLFVGVPGPYYYGYYPYPRYVVVPCVDNNRDGHCDRHAGHHDDGNGHGGQHQQGNGSATPPLQQYVPPRVQPRVDPPSAPPAPAVRPQANRPATSGASMQPEPPPKAHQDPRDDRPARPLIP